MNAPKRPVDVMTEEAERLVADMAELLALKGWEFAIIHIARPCEVPGEPDAIEIASAGSYGATDRMGPMVGPLLDRTREICDRAMAALTAAGVEQQVPLRHEFEVSTLEKDRPS